MPIDFRELLLRRVLNLPTPEQKAAGAAKQAQRRAERAARKRGEQPPTAPAAPAAPVVPPPSDGARWRPVSAEANPWANLSTAAAAGEGSAATPRPVVKTPTGAAFELAPANTGAMWLGRALRVSGLVVLLLFAWVGIRETFIDRDDTSAVVETGGEIPPALLFDTSAAGGTAARLTMNTLSWDEDADQDSRISSIADDLAGGDDPIVWNGAGRQDVITAIPAGVLVAEDGQAAIVTVQAQVRPYERTDEGEWEAQPSAWLTVHVPVAVEADQIVAVGGPAIVGDAEATAWPELDRTDRDTDLTVDTRATAEAFFVGYGAGDVSALQAPGAAITAPTSSWTVASVPEWSVLVGSGDTRYARATVVWTVEDTDVQIRSNYVVTLTQVSGGGADRWEVSAITTAVPAAS